MKRLLSITVLWLIAMTAAASPWGAQCIQPITFDQPVNGQLTTSDCWYYYADTPQNAYYVDVYTFSGTAGQQISITMTSPSMDSWLVLQNVNDVSGNELAHDDDGGGNANARIPSGSGYFTLPATGTYYIRAESAYPNAAGTGPYTLTLHLNAVAPPPGGTITVTEFYHPGFNHYFITAYPAEAASLAAGNLPPWTPTGQTWQVWSGPGAGITNVCRFFSGQTYAPRSSHFYSGNAVECPGLQAGGVWALEAADAFYMMTTATGVCPADAMPLYRLYNNGMSGAPNHRYTVSQQIRTTMIGAGWIPEGNGPDGVFACVPKSGGTPPGSAFQQEITGYADLMLGLVNGSVVNTDQLTLVLSSALDALGNPGSTCPVATSTPPLANLTAIPPSLTINVSYGNGCNVQGGGNIAGSAVLSLTNFVVTDNAVSGNLSATFNNLRVNGAAVANGAVQASLNLLVNSATEAVTGTVTINFNAFQLPSFGLSGSIGISLNTATNTTVTTNLVTSPHNVAIKVNLTIVPQSGGGVLVNSTGASTVGAYTVQVNNVRINSDVCTTGAIGGTISFTQGGQTGTLTFDNSCHYTYSGP